MNDAKFKRLQRLIHSTEIFLGEMQKLHRQETGRDYVISGPLPPEDDLKEILLGGLDRINDKLEKVLLIQNSPWYVLPKKTAKEITDADKTN